jgi:co-chaperonin GroES (HSP10)
MAQDGRSIPGGGDALARGVRSSTFPGLVKCPPECECASCRPELHFKASEPEEVPATVDNSALFAPKKPAVMYRGIPLSDRILLRRIEHEASTPIIIPDSAKGKSDMGVVVATSIDSDMPLPKGTKVLFDKFAAVGQEISLFSEEDGRECEHLLVQECDVLLILEPYSEAETGTCVQ